MGVMNSKSISLFFIIGFLTSTSLGLHHLVVTARRSLDIILARQLNAGQCASLCTSVSTTVQSCTTPDCLCTTAIAVSVQDCINCAIGNDPSIGEVSSAQSIVDSFESLCSSVAGIPSVTINTNPGTSQSTPTAIVPLTTSVPVSQIVIGPSSTTTIPITQAASSLGSTSTASVGGLPLKSTASPNKIIFQWTGALLALTVGNLLVF